MGPQSSGKSTLLNACFGTSFREMDALKGRSQTTHGVWLARAAPPAGEAGAAADAKRPTLVLDLEVRGGAGAGGGK